MAVTLTAVASPCRRSIGSGVQCGWYAYGIDDRKCFRCNRDGGAPRDRINGIALAVQPIGVTGLSYTTEEMDDAAKEHFFTLAQAGWKL